MRSGRVRSDGRTAFGATIQGEVDARVDRQGQGEGQAGVAGAKGNDAGRWVHLVAAENTVLDVVEGEDEAANNVTIENVTIAKEKARGREGCNTKCCRKIRRMWKWKCEVAWRGSRGSCT